MSTRPAVVQGEFQDRLVFEAMLADLSSKFINLPPAEVDPAIEAALRRVCELLGIDFAVLWQWSAPTPDVIAPTHAYPPWSRSFLPSRCMRSSSRGSGRKSWLAAWSLCHRWRSFHRKPTSTMSTAAVTASSRI